MEPVPSNKYFHAGGTLPLHFEGYVKRPADEAFVQALSAGEFCYVLTARQFGKSSLMVRAKRRLEAAGITTAEIDVSTMGSLHDPALWYLTFVHRLGDKLQLPQLKEWWDGADPIALAERLLDLLRKVLVVVPHPVVILVDEIDSTLNLQFTDDFFAAIRAAYNLRATEPAFNRLTFGLMGVASPSDLIKDETRTPFNIGKRIALDDFRLEEAEVLTRALPGDAKTQDALIQRIFYWTGGHPYLTQRLCSAIANRPDSAVPSAVDALVEQLILSPEGNYDDNIRFVRERLLRSERRDDILRVYRRVRGGKQVRFDPRAPVQSELLLSGVVTRREEQIVVRNRIYEKAFDLAWTRKVLPINWTGPLAAAASAVAVALLVLYGYQQLHVIPSRYAAELAGYGSDVPSYVAEDKARQLASVWGRAHEASGLLAEYWDRRADTKQRELDFEGEMLLRLRALTISDDVKRRQHINQLARALEPRDHIVRRGGALGYSDDGRLAFISSQDKLSIRDMRSGSTRNIPGVTPALSALSKNKQVSTLSGDGSQFVTCLGAECQWRDANTGGDLSRVVLPKKPRRFALSSDGSTLAAVLEDHTVAAVKQDGSSKIFRPPGGGGALGVSSTGRFVGLINTGSITLLDTVRGETVNLYTFQLSLKSILRASANSEAFSVDIWSPQEVRFSPDESVMAVAYGSEVLLWDTSLRELLGQVATGGQVQDMAFSADSKLLALADSGTNIIVYEARRQKRLYLIKNPGRANFVRFTPEGLLLADASGIVRYWRPPSASEADQMCPTRRWGELLPNGRIVVRDLLGAWGGPGAVILAKDGKMELGAYPSADAVFLDPNHMIALLYDKQGIIRAIDASTGKLLRGKQRVGANARSVLMGLSDDTSLVGVAKDYPWFPSPVAFNPSELRIYGFASGQLVQIIRGEREDPISDFKFVPKGRLVAILFSDRVEIVDGVSGELKCRTNSVPVLSAAEVELDATGQHFLVKEGAQVRVFDTANCQLESTLAYQAKVSSSMEAWFLASGAIATYANGAIQLWDTDGHLLATRYVGFMAGRPLQEPGSKSLKVALYVGDGWISLRDIQLDEADVPPIAGESSRLYEEWATRLDARIDPRGEVPAPNKLSPAEAE
ncbi:AAA-like domain-containing protein [Hyalangium versicolor]|uniref:AAA-like domain-containing protein n=1 Tax=Hyalangium versicolor TaxID=2861190 RepID=UPI001CCF3538|nr:AAA-like domain-containing protein [Hyalangium versicolor]